jgi:hypothetical protein
MDVASGAARPSPRHAAPGHATERPWARVRRIAHARREPRHPHARSHRLARSPVLSPPRVAQSGARPPAGQTQAFDQLLTQLTASGAPAGHTAPAPSLTPPPAGQPNPFAQDGGSR